MRKPEFWTVKREAARRGVPWSGAHGIVFRWGSLRIYGGISWRGK